MRTRAVPKAKLYFSSEASFFGGVMAGPIRSSRASAVARPVDQRQRSIARRRATATTKRRLARLLAMVRSFLIGG
jgi:hypothetical protein